MDYLTPMEAAFEAFFDRWPDYPPEEVAESWRDSIEHAARAAIAALDQTQTGFCRNCGAVNPLDQPEPGEDCKRCGGTGAGELPIPLAGGPEDNDLIPDECELCKGTGRRPKADRCPVCGVKSKATLTDQCHGCGAPEYGYKERDV